MADRVLTNCKAPDALCQKGLQIWERTFAGKTPSPKPEAFIMCGVQGSGKTTAADRVLADHPHLVMINPDLVMIDMLAPQTKLPDGPGGKHYFAYSQQLTAEMLAHAWQNRYSMLLDLSLPPVEVLHKMQQKGYKIHLMALRTPERTARKREIDRDINKLKWGRVGISSASHLETDLSVKKMLPILIGVADTVTTCDNSGAKMKCIKKRR